MDKASLLSWWPKVRDLPIPMPRTEIIKSTHNDLCDFLYPTKRNAHKLDRIVQEVREAGDRIGWPVFLRTDFASAKHDFKDSCFVEGAENLSSHIYTVIEFNECADMMGLPYTALVVREYLPLEAPFKAFWGELPIAREWRYFVRNGEIECAHPYWPVEAIEESCWQPEDCPNWRDLLAELSITDPVDTITLATYACLVAQVMEGYWSVDFAKGQDGRWYLIDMAPGEQSWHPACDQNPRSGG